MEKYLFDSNFLIDFLRGDTTIIKKFKSLSKGQCFVSEITVLEVLYGAYLSNNVESEITKAKKFLSLFNTVILLGIEDKFCTIKAALKRSGKIIEDADIIIAATALSNNLILVSNNLKHFNRIDNLKTEDWKTQI